MSRTNLLLALTLAAWLMCSPAAPPVHGGVGTTPFRTYTVGLVSNPGLPAPDGELILNVYLAVSEDGTGIGLLSDPVHPQVGSHVAIHTTSRQGNQLRFDGTVTRSNDPARMGLPLNVFARIADDGTSQLQLLAGGHSYDGQGAVIRSKSFLPSNF